MTALLTLIFKVTAKVRVNLLGLWLACTGGGSCYLLDKYFFLLLCFFSIFLVWLRACFLLPKRRVKTYIRRHFSVGVSAAAAAELLKTY